MVSLGGDSEDGSALSPIAKAAEKTAAMSGARYSGTGEAIGSRGEMQMTFEGVYNADTDRSFMRMEIESPQQPQMAAMLSPAIGIQDGLTMYQSMPIFSRQLPGGASWMKLDFSAIAEGAETSGSLDARALIDQLEATGDDVRAIGEEKVRGVSTTHYAATLDAARLAEQYRAEGNELGAKVVEQQGGSTAVDVWIDRRNLVRRMAMSMPFELVAGPGASMSMTMDYYGYGITPDIDLPPDFDVYDATEESIQGLEEAVG